MIPVAKISGILGALEWAGSRRTLAFATVMIVIRGVMFAMVSDSWTLLGLCFLDGLSAGAFGVLAVLMVTGESVFQPSTLGPLAFCGSCGLWVNGKFVRLIKGSCPLLTYVRLLSPFLCR